jgi:hypothetical protein
VIASVRGSLSWPARVSRRSRLPGSLCEPDALALSLAEAMSTRREAGEGQGVRSTLTLGSEAFFAIVLQLAVRRCRHFIIRFATSSVIRGDVPTSSFLSYLRSISKSSCIAVCSC